MVRDEIAISHSELVSDMIKKRKNNPFSTPEYHLVDENNESYLIAKAYGMTNEYIGKYISKIVKKDSRILSVGAAGDHYLNAILYGAKDVDLFDINALSYYYALLKIVSARVLSYEDFISFMTEGSSFLNKTIYDRVSNCLPKDIKLFFDNLYNNFKNINECDLSMIFNGIFMFREVGYPSQFNPYLEKSSFSTLKRSLDDKSIPEFTIGDILNIGKRLDGIYDGMIFSNIGDYVDVFFDDFVANNCFKNLSDRGVIQLLYHWGSGLDYIRDNYSFDKYDLELKKLSGAYNGHCDSSEGILLMRKTL